MSTIIKPVTEPINYQYDKLQISISGNRDNLCVIARLSEKTLQRIQTFSIEQLRAANKAAWTAKRKAERDMNKYCNVSVYGHASHDYASQSYQVSDLVCKATWRVLKSKNAA